MTKTPHAAAPTPADTDLMLVERTVAGDQKAFELLVLKYQRRIERLIGRMVRDTDLVEDIAQETFIRAYRALPSSAARPSSTPGCTGSRSIRPRRRWSTSSATRWSRKARCGAATRTTMKLPRVENELTTAETPETVLAAKEIAAAVNSAMEALPEELRQAVTLREIEGLSYEEIAEVMNCPIGTVRSRIFRAREAISAKVKPLLENQSGKRW